jgi:hypothetical protein
VAFWAVNELLVYAPARVDLRHDRAPLALPDQKPEDRPHRNSGIEEY